MVYITLFSQNGSINVVMEENSIKLNVVSILIDKTLYSILVSVADKIKGIQFTLQGVSSGPDLRRSFCQNHLHGDDTTQFFAVQSYVNQVSPRQVMSFDQEICSF